MVLYIINLHLVYLSLKWLNILSQKKDNIKLYLDIIVLILAYKNYFLFVKLYIHFNRNKMFRFNNKYYTIYIFVLYTL